MATMTSAAPPTAPKTNYGSAMPDQQKPAPQIPFMSNSSMQAPMQLTPEAMKPPTPPTPQKVTDTKQGNEAVLKTAQETAINQRTSPLSGLVQQRTQQYLQDPNLGYDPRANIQNQMDQYNADQSKAMEASRQQLANTSQSGELQNEFLKNALTVSQGRANLQSTLTQQAADTTQKNYLNALASGREGMTAQQGETTSQIGNLATVRGMAEGERAQTTGFQENVELTKMGFSHEEQMAALNNGYDLAKMEKAFGYDTAKMITASNLDTASKTELMKLQDSIDTGQLLKAQDFQAIQNNLDRQEKIALQKGDIEGQLQIQALRGEIDAKAQAAQNEFAKTERVATQAWQSGERIETQDFNKAMQYYDWAKKDAAQKNDIDAEKTIEQMRENTQLAMQTQEMGHEEKMAYINSQIAEAKANKDTDRQLLLINFQTTQELTTMAAQGTIDEAKITLQGNIQKAIAQGDHEAASAMQQAGFVFQSGEAAKDRNFEKYKFDLQQQGINIDKLEEAYKSGAISVDAYQATLKKLGDTMGIKVTPPDPLATQKELTKIFNETKIQWSLSHPEYLNNPTDPNSGLSANGMSAFNDFYNSTLYNDQDIGSSQFKPIIFDNKSQTTNEKAFETTPPPIGSYIRWNGNTYKVSSDVAPDSSPQGGGRLQFQAIDQKTGQIITIKAENSQTINNRTPR